MSSPPHRRTYRGRTLEEAVESLPSRRMRGDLRRNQYIAILLIVVILAAAGAYVAVSTPSSGSAGGGGSSTIAVVLGAPSSGHVTCGDGKSMVTEWVTWVSSSASVNTGQFRLEVQEIGDGDVIGADNAPGDVTPTNLCLGNSQPYVYDWYGVLQAPNGTNEATYTYANGWQGVESYPTPVSVVANSTLMIVSASPFVGLGYAIEVLPFGPGPAVNGFSAL